MAAGRIGLNDALNVIARRVPDRYVPLTATVIVALVSLLLSTLAVVFIKCA